MAISDTPDCRVDNNLQVNSEDIYQQFCKTTIYSLNIWEPSTARSLSINKAVSHKDKKDLLDFLEISKYKILPGGQ